MNIVSTQFFFFHYPCKFNGCSMGSSMEYARTYYFPRAFTLRDITIRPLTEIIIFSPACPALKFVYLGDSVSKNSWIWINYLYKAEYSIRKSVIWPNAH